MFANVGIIFILLMAYNISQKINIYILYWGIVLSGRCISLYYFLPYYTIRHRMYIIYIKLSILFYAYKMSYLLSLQFYIRSVLSKCFSLNDTIRRNNIKIQSLSWNWNESTIDRKCIILYYSICNRIMNLCNNHSQYKMVKFCKSESIYKNNDMKDDYKNIKKILLVYEHLCYI